MFVVHVPIPDGGYVRLMYIVSGLPCLPVHPYMQDNVKVFSMVAL